MSKFKILAIWEQIQNKKNNNVDGEFRQKFLTSRGQRLRITAAKKTLPTDLLPQASLNVNCYEAKC